MTDYSPRLPRLTLFIFLLIMAVFLWMLCGCNSQRRVVKQSFTTDSTAIREKQDSIRMLTREVGRLESEIRELQYAGVVFLRDTVNRVDTVTNTVTITKDGSIEARGRIASAFVSKETMMRLTYELQRERDSLAVALQKEKQNVKREQVTKEVEKQVRFLPWFYWPLIIAAFAFGSVAGWRARQKVKL